jgi:hypothetical protein
MMKDWERSITCRWLVRERVKPEEEVGDAGVDKVAWLALGRFNESVRVWDLETERCETTLLYPTVDGPKHYYSRGVSRAHTGVALCTSQYRRWVVDCMYGICHPTGRRRGMRLGKGAKTVFGFLRLQALRFFIEMNRSTAVWSSAEVALLV